MRAGLSFGGTLNTNTQTHSQTDELKECNPADHIEMGPQLSLIRWTGEAKDHTRDPGLQGDYTTAALGVHLFAIII